MAQGIPVLRGPYTVDWSDIPHDGDTRTLWVPQVGDVLLRLFPDWQSVTPWDHGMLFVGQNVDGTVTTPNSHNCIVNSWGGTANLDTDIQTGSTDSSGAQHITSAYVFHTTDPVQIQLAQTGGTSPTQGHVELYALVARAVAP